MANAFCVKERLSIFLSGDLLHTIDTAQMYNGQVSISPCKDLVGASGFSPQVHFWEVKFSKGGTFQGVSFEFLLF